MPQVALDRWLGRTKAEVEAALGPPQRQQPDGWVAYGETWSLKYEDGCAVELRCLLPNGTDCPEAARLTGYDDCPAVSASGSQCVWPGRYLSGRFDPASRRFSVALLREGRACRSPDVGKGEPNP